jgi:hypothetical protein
MTSGPLPPLLPTGVPGSRASRLGQLGVVSNPVSCGMQAQEGHALHWHYELQDSMLWFN